MVRLPRGEFQARGYKTVKTLFFSVKVKSNETNSSRIGIVVGKNVHKTAVKRNFWKRQARAALQPLVPKGMDVIVVLQPRVNELTKRQFQDVMKKTIRGLS
jgi:ribonuclease P protein component